MEKKSYFGIEAKKNLLLYINNLTEALSLKHIPRIVDLANAGFKLQLYWLTDFDMCIGL